MFERPCRNVAPHPAHPWHPAPFESVFSDVSHKCPGVPDPAAPPRSTRADAGTDSLWRYAVSWRESGAVLGPDLMLWAGREIDRLRTVIDNASHDEYCAHLYGPDPCDCWKATALDAEDQTPTALAEGDRT